MIKKAAISSAKVIKDNVSLTLLLISFALIVGSGILQIFDKVKSVGPFMELFLTCGGLYFGRQWVKSKAPKEEPEEKTEEL